MININEYLINKQTKSLKYDIPELNYDKLNSDDVYKLKDFLKDNDLMPKTKMQKDDYQQFGKWDIMIKPIDDYRDGYVLAYWWGTSLYEHADTYLIFLEDGVSHDYHYKFEEDKKVLAELEKIIDVFGKSKEWKDD